MRVEPLRGGRGARAVGRVPRRAARGWDRDRAGGVRRRAGRAGPGPRPRTLAGDVAQSADAYAAALAGLGWQAMTQGLFLAGALASDDRDAGPQRTTRRAFVLHRLAAVAGSGRFPALTAMAADLHDALRGRWGEVPLELAPAFR